MKYLKIVGLAAVAAASMMAFVGTGTASANTVLCETTVTTGCAAAGWDWEPGSKAILTTTLKAGTTARLTDTSGFITIDTCTVGGVTGSLGTTTTPKGTVEASGVTWGSPEKPCTRTTDTITGGELEIHHIAGTHNGTVTATGFAVTIPWNSETETCAYGFNAARDIGTFVPGPEGTDGELSINTVVNAIAPESDPGCPSSGKWIATYTQTSETHLYVAES